MLWEKQQKAVVGFHAYIGNDYVSSFMRTTKKVWKSVTENEEILMTFFDRLEKVS